MYRIPLFALSCLFVACATSSPAPSLAPKRVAGARSAAPTTASAKGEDETKDPAVDILLLESELSFQSAEKYRLRSRRIVKLLTPAGVRSWQTIEASWSPWYQTRPVIEATVTTPDGKKHPLDTSAMVENGVDGGSSTMLSDGRVLRVPLPALAVGATVDVTITRGAHRAFLGAGQYIDIRLQAHPMVARRRVILTAPKDLALHSELRGATFKPKVDETKSGVRRLVYELGRAAKNVEVEAWLQPSVPSMSYLAVSSAGSWRDISKTYSKIVDERIKGAVDAALVASALGGKTVKQLGRRKAVETLVRWVRKNVRYTGVEFGSAAIVPYKPAEVLRRKFGDCKDQSSLLVALLRKVGISAHVALLNASTAEDTIASLPGAQQFNHAIVYIPGKTALWIDPTSSYTRVGDLPVGVEGRLALVADGKSNLLIPTHLSRAADNRYKETRVVYLPPAGKAKVVETSESYGAIESKIRWHAASLSEAKLRKELEAYSKRLYLAKEVPVVRWTATDDYSVPFGYHIEVAKSRHGVTEDTDTSSVLDTDILFNWLPRELRPGKDAKTVARRQPLYLVSPYSAELNYRIIGPPGFELRALPKNTTVNLGPARFSVTYRHNAKENEVFVSTRFSTEKRVYSPAEVDAFRKAWRALDNKTPTVSFQNEAFLSLQNGKIKEAVTKARAVVARYPKEPVHRGRYAMVLLKAGFGIHAHQEAKKAVALAPESIWLQRTLSWVLQHDEIGRRFGRGFDREGSLAALRRAKKLDPKDVSSRVHLAFLLQHDSEGRRFAPRANAKEAVVEYRALRDELKLNDYDDDLMIGLLRLEDYAGVRKLLKTLAPSFERQVVEMTAIAAVDGAQAAVDYARRTKYGQEELAKLMGSTMLTLLQNRRYAAAVSLVQLYAPDKNAGQFATIFGGLKRYDGSKFERDTPENFVRRFMARLMSGTMMPEDLPRWLADVNSLEVSELRKVKQLMAAGTRDPNWSRMGGRPEMMLDMLNSLSHYKTDGSSKLGYRVRMSKPGAPTSALLSLYVVKTKRGLRLAAAGGDWGGIGREVLRHLWAGRLAAAHQWLDWSLEEAVQKAPYLHFGKFWRHGKKADKQTVAVAAAVLHTQAERRIDPKVIAILEEAAKAYRKNKAPAKVRWIIESSLATALASTDRNRELLAAVDKWDENNPNEKSRFHYREKALLALGRYPELAKLAQNRLEEYPNDQLATWARMKVAMEGSKDYKRARQILRGHAKVGTAGSASAYNTAAWLALFSSPLDKTAIKDAEQAHSLSSGKNAYVLDTLATLYAETGDLGAARKYWLQGLELRGLDPEGGDWYVYGRIAEQAGLRDLAKTAYKRVKKEDDDPTSRHALAQRRLQTLR